MKKIVFKMFAVTLVAMFGLSGCAINNHRPPRNDHGRHDQDHNDHNRDDHYYKSY